MKIAKETIRFRERCLSFRRQRSAGWESTDENMSQTFLIGSLSLMELPAVTLVRCDLIKALGPVWVMPADAEHSIE